jgi:hypothetical protein
MADKEKHPRPSRAADANAEDYSTTSSQAGTPSGDFAYTVEVVATINRELGRLTEAVESLKSQAVKHGDKLEQFGKDIHAAKVVVGFVGGLIVLAGTFLGFTINALVQYLASHPAK